MDPRKELEHSIRLREQGDLSFREFLEKILTYLARDPDQLADVLVRLGDHPNETVQGAVPAVLKSMQMREEFERAKDIDHLRRTSPLQPGTRLTLGGGYTAAYEAPRWLNGRDSYPATFREFIQGKITSLPVAWVEFDEEITTDAGKGRYALLKLLYEGTWTDNETVVVHIVEARPEDIGAFYAQDPFPYAKAAETHATYQIVNAPKATKSQVSGPN